MPFPKKPGKRMQTRKQAHQAADRTGSAEVRKRSEGRCEVHFYFRSVLLHCPFRATQVHHLIGGRGKRGIGPSASAEHKQHVCDSCHLDITGDVGGKRLFLKQTGELPVFTDRYERRSQRSAA